MKLTGIVTLAFLLAACGGGDGSSYQSAADVAKAAGCTRYQDTSPELYAADAGTCTHDGHQTAVQWFNSADDRATWVKAAGNFGPVVSGSNWAIECDNHADCQAIQDAIGGTLN